MRAFLRDTLGTLILAGVFVFLLQTVITIPPSEVVSGSMEPTLQVGQRLIISKIAYTFHEPERGDIITFHPPNSPKAIFIKRIIGLPGESVETKTGKVYIYKGDKIIELDEPYIMEPTYAPYERGMIPEDKYFVLGDNRNNSGDSRTGWVVPRQNIIGKAWLSIWPPDRWGPAPNHSFE